MNRKYTYHFSHIDANLSSKILETANKNTSRSFGPNKEQRKFFFTRPHGLTFNSLKYLGLNVNFLNFSTYKKH